MIVLKAYTFALLVYVCIAEPPVQNGGFGGYNYAAPTSNYPSNSYGAPSHGFSSPSTTYGTPSSSFGTTNHGFSSSGYNTGSNYNAPTGGYAGPTGGFKTPVPGYNNPSSGHHGTNYAGASGGSNSGYDSHDYHEDYDHSEPKSYEFGYAVKDPYTGNDYGRKETSDGNTVQGEYRVQLPDGRTQIVTYHADWKTGFHADVRYEGEAKYPETSGYTGPKNQFGSFPAQGQYAQPSGTYAPAGGSGQYHTPEFSGSITGFGGTGKYDSYAPSGIGSQKPSSAYGTPAFH